jgi:hypothetical protein
MIYIWMISCQSPRIIIFSQFIKSLKQNYTQISSKSNIFLSIYKWNCYINPSLLYLLSFLVSLKAYHCYHKPTQIRILLCQFQVRMSPLPLHQLFSQSRPVYIPYSLEQEMFLQVEEAHFL